MKYYLEQFLHGVSEQNGSMLSLVGGSPLFNKEINWAISINGFHKECTIAAINGNRSDFKRCRNNFQCLIAPNPQKEMPDDVIVSKNKFVLPKDFPGRMPTTYFSLALICENLKIPTEIYGICGRASKYHYGDWEMWYMKHKINYPMTKDHWVCKYKN